MQVGFYCCVYVPLLAKYDAFKALMLRLIHPKGRASQMLGDQDNVVTIDFAKSVQEQASSDATEGASGGLRGAMAASLSASIASTKRVTFEVGAALST